MQDRSISINDIINIIIVYWQMKLLRFSDEYKSSGWKLSDDNTLCERVRGPDEPNWILADIDPWFKGIHCWRIQLTNPNKAWFSIGVHNRNLKSLNGMKFDKKYVWAIGAANNWYPGRDFKTEKNFKQYIRLEYVEIDVLLNLDRALPEMKICAVNKETPLKETRLYDIKENDQGWIPYFNMYYQGAVGATIRFALIEPDCYGVPIDDLFPPKL